MYPFDIISSLFIACFIAFLTLIATVSVAYLIYKDQQRIEKDLRKKEKARKKLLRDQKLTEEANNIEQLAAREAEEERKGCMANGETEQTGCLPSSTHRCAQSLFTA